VKCHHCKEDIDIIWALCSHGRAYCSSTCFEGRKDDARTDSSSHAEPPTVNATVPEKLLPLAFQQGHK
jgi:hypothetical protein